MKDLDEHGIDSNGAGNMMGSGSSSSSMAMSSRASGHELGGGGHGNEGGIHDIEQRPSSNSLVVLIEQALQSGDDALLEQCLGNKQPTLNTPSTCPNHVVPTLSTFPLNTPPTRLILLLPVLSTLLLIPSALIITDSTN